MKALDKRKKREKQRRLVAVAGVIRHGVETLKRRIWRVVDQNFIHGASSKAISRRRGQSFERPNAIRLAESAPEGGKKE